MSYELIYPTRSQSSHRQKNIFEIKKICKEIEEHEGQIHTHRQLNIDRIQEILSSADSADKSKNISASDRFGGKGFSLFALLNFIRKAALALKHLFTSTTSDVSKWNIYSGKRDASVNYTEFEGLPQQQIKFFPRADHALHFGHHAGTVNRQIIKDIEHRFSAFEHEKNDTDFFLK